jgi:hypothetical protein
MTSRYRHRCCRPDRATGPARACSAAVSGHLVGTRRRSATSSPGSTGPARVVMGSLLDRRRPEHASAGRGHAPSGNRTKARSIGPLDGSPMAHPYPVAGGVARSGRDGVRCRLHTCAQRVVAVGGHGADPPKERRRTQATVSGDGVNTIALHAPATLADEETA